MNRNVFEIRDLNCSYNNGNVVLKAKNVDIPRGGLTILLGISGSGKSTLLETLGLMNNTLTDSSEITYYSNNHKLSYNDIWKKKESFIASIRNDYFSFIFQDTNLMPGFTAYENVAVTQLLQGKSFDESLHEVKKYMRIMGLDEVSLDKKAHELAGGQKQRLAFVRAITPQFDVLFADEPTGNLDRKNAREVMLQLKNQVKNLNKSAIIVTHDILLAEEFADQIIVINKTNGIGIIENENVFVKNNEMWENNNGKTIEIRIKLKKLLGFDE